MKEDKQKTVAVIGASKDRSKYGNKAVRAYKEIGYKVYPVNPKEEVIEGIKTYKSILDIPDKIDRATLYLPSKLGIRVIEEIAEKGVGELYFNPGSESDELVKKARELNLNPILACSILAVGKNPELDISSV
ncbi:CoA-binding protein [Candidatus Poribacteria bacterium]|nr:CoA-binding protein [Candidatus Poribacteria bacterium]